MLDKLYTDQFDAEQIWQQMDHKFQVFLNDSYVKSVARLITEDAGGFNVQTSSSSESHLTVESPVSAASESDVSVVNNDSDGSDAEEYLRSPHSSGEEHAPVSESDGDMEENTAKGKRSSRRSGVNCFFCRCYCGHGYFCH